MDDVTLKGDNFKNFKAELGISSFQGFLCALKFVYFKLLKGLSLYIFLYSIEMFYLI